MTSRRTVVYIGKRIAHTLPMPTSLKEKTMSEIKQGMEYWVTVEADRDRLLSENRALRSALEQLVDHATHDGALGNGEVAVVAARAALKGAA